MSKTPPTWFGRFLESRWTRLFIFTALLQTIVVFVLESIIFQKNSDELTDIQLATNDTISLPVLGYVGTDMSNDTSPAIILQTRFRRMKWENFWFMTFQVWLFWVAADGIYNQNTVEIIAMAAINVLCAVYACIQVSEAFKWRAFIQDNGLDVSVGEVISAEKLTIIMLVLIIIFAVGFFYLTWQLYRQFGWSIYKRIGADTNKLVMYRTFQIYILLIKMGIYFEFVTSTFFVFEAISDIPYVKKPDYVSIAIRAIIAILIPFALFGGRRAVALESRFWAITVVIFHLVVGGNFATMLQQTILPNYNWYFWVFVVVLGVISSIACSIGAALTLINFNKGLQPFVQLGKKADVPATITRFELESDAGSIRDGVEAGTRMNEIEAISPRDKGDLESLIQQENQRMHSIDLEEKTEL